MKMTYTKSAFEMPDGKYLAKFVGVTMREPTGTVDKKGQPMPPPMTWDFVIQDAGEHAGKTVDRLTGRQPTPKSACGKILSAICDSVLKDGTEVDLAQFVGQLYRITVEDNKVSDSPPPVRVYGQANTAASDYARPPQTAPANGPPPRQTPPVGPGRPPGASPPPPAADPVGELYKVWTPESTWALMDAPGLRNWLRSNNFSAANTWIHLSTQPTETNRPATEFGFTDAAAFAGAPAGAGKVEEPIPY